MHMCEHTLPVHADRLNYSRVTEWWSQGGDTPPGHHARASLLPAPSSAGFCWHMDTHSWWLHPDLWLTSKLLQAFFLLFFSFGYIKLFGHVELSNITGNWVLCCSTKTPGHPSWHSSRNFTSAAVPGWVCSPHIAGGRQGQGCRGRMRGARTARGFAARLPSERCLYWFCTPGDTGRRGKTHQCVHDSLCPCQCFKSN